jgi:alpha-tubulin suppressor-like RCC1 family protein
MAIGADRSVACWGRNSFGECLVPEFLTAVVQVGADLGASYALCADGTLHAWGSQSILPSTVEDVEFFVQGPLVEWKRQILVVSKSGTVQSFGTAFGPPPGLDDVVGAAAGVYHALALRAGGEVICWGFPDEQLLTVPEGLGAVQAVAAGEDRSVVLDAAGSVHCWGWNGTQVPPSLGVATAIASGLRHSVALGADGTVYCWGGNASGQCDVPSDLIGAVAIAAGAASTVALLADGSISSWGAVGSAPSLAKDFVSVRARGGQCVALSAAGHEVCWGTGCEPRPPAIGRVVSVSGMADHTVILNEFGGVRCFGDNSLGQCDVPADLSTVQSISASGGVTLALQVDGTQRAWGAWIVPTAVIYCVDGLKGIRALDAGGAHAVFLSESGGVSCSGWNSDGQCVVPVDLGAVSVVSAGGSHTVALRSDGSVAAWGGYEIVSDVPAGLRGVTDISAGGLHTLALREDGTVTCWGWPFSDACNVPPDLEEVVGIEAGDVNVALLQDGRIRCWPDAESGICAVAASRGSVTAVATGGLGGGTLLMGEDCNANRLPDAIEIDRDSTLDCDRNGRLDACELSRGEASDCDANGRVDSCDIAVGFDSDVNANGVPDACDFPWGDLNRDGVVSAGDLSRLLTAWGGTAESLADLNRDGLVGAADLTILLGRWGAFE